MRENPSGSAPARIKPSSLRYLPATLVSAFLAALLIALPDATDWAQPAAYSFFLKMKGPPPPSRSTVLISDLGAADAQDKAAVRRLARAILNQHPAALAIDLPADWANDAAGKNSGASASAMGGDAGSDVSEALPPGPLIIAHEFSGFKPWAFSEAAVRAYPPAVSHSLYPLLDGPGGPDLPMGDGLRLGDSLWKSSGLSTGFRSLPRNASVILVPAFAKLGRGVVANLGVEAARRALGVAAEKVAFVEGVGALFGAEHVLPLDAHGAMALRYYGPGGIPRLSAARILDGSLPKDALRGKLAFLSAGAASAQVATPAGRMPSAELWANAAADLLDGSALSLPSWGGILSVTLGILFAAVIALSVFLEFGGAAVLGLAALLAAAYPLLSLAVFLTSSSWLPPALPPLLVASVYFPFALSRLAFPARGPARAIAPAPAYEQALVSMSPGAVRASAATGAMPVMPMTPGRGTPRVAAGAPPAPASSPSVPPHAPQPAPPMPPSAAPVRPRSPAERTAPAERAPAPIAGQNPPASPAPAGAARFADPRDPPLIAGGQPPQPAVARSVAAPAHTGNIADDIERDSKGGLVRVGKYRIVRKMGFGSAGDVFEGLDTHMGRKVAIKTITKNAAAHFDRAAERFVVEAKAAGSLNHPCINTVYDFGTVRDVSYMVLEYLDGITLSQWMRNNPAPPRPDVVSHWLEQICSALDYAHSHKVIHRDLKPSNLMIVNNGATIKLLDFGIAKLEDVGLTQTGMTVGTPSYMSPEQLSGLKVGPASDQYGMAVVIYQLFTYKLPYIGTKIPELCNRILKNDLVPITEANPALGAAFWEALRKGMAKAPEDRYPNCMAMCQALEAAFPIKNAPG